MKVSRTWGGGGGGGGGGAHLLEWAGGEAHVYIGHAPSDVASFVGPPQPCRLYVIGYTMLKVVLCLLLCSIKLLQLAVEDTRQPSARISFLCGFCSWFTVVLFVFVLKGGKKKIVCRGKEKEVFWVR